jgi:hypothetical protein
VLPIRNEAFAPLSPIRSTGAVAGVEADAVTSLPMSDRNPECPVRSGLVSRHAQRPSSFATRGARDEKQAD